MTEWMPVSSLEKTDIDYAERIYSQSVLLSHNLLSGIELEYYKEEMERCKTDPEVWRTAEELDLFSKWVPEPVDLKEENGEIFWRLHDKMVHSYENREFTTKFGTYRVRNEGKFGGEIHTPGGKRYSGNYVDVFDFDGSVYAVSSYYFYYGGSMDIERFDAPDKCKTIYRSGKSMWDDVFKKILGEDEKDEDESTENMGYLTRYIDRDCLYILVAGTKKYKQTPEKDGDWESVARILKIRNKQKEVFREIPIRDKKDVLAGEIYSVLLKGDLMYLGRDKMMTILNMNTGETTHYTFLDEEAKEDLLRNKRWNEY